MDDKNSGQIPGRKMKRGRNQRRRQGANPNRAYDSNGPEVRIRGTANQIHDKYQALARDASSAGDRVKAENYLQHAEHYFRLIRSMQPAQAPQQDADFAEGEQPGVPSASQEAAAGQEDRSNGKGRGRRGGNGASRQNGADREARSNGVSEDAPASDDDAPSAPVDASTATETSEVVDNSNDTPNDGDEGAVEATNGSGSASADDPEAEKQSTRRRRTRR
ncbi:MAG: DUF4167 domain-containing protein, partial [Pseudomonadota bacterium]